MRLRDTWFIPVSIGLGSFAAGLIGDTSAQVAALHAFMVFTGGLATLLLSQAMYQRSEGK